MRPFRKIFLVVISSLAWVALLIQFYLNLQSGAASIAELIVRYFSYFTILTNLLVAVLTTSLIKKEGRLTKFFSNQSTQTATAVYVFIVGLIYNLILRSAWHPQGLQKLADELLHVINPVLFIMFWALFSNRYPLKWRVISGWLIYPLLYVAFVLIRAVLSGFYPYPFLDMNKIGSSAVFKNCMGITVLFIITSVIFLMIGNYLAVPKTKSKSLI